MKIRPRLTLTIGSLVLVLGTVLVLLAMTLDKTVGRFEMLLAKEKALAANASQAYVALLQARRAEKDFLARMQVSYVGKHAAAMDGFVAELDLLARLGMGATALHDSGDAAEGGSKRTIDSLLEEIRRLEGSYRQSFAAVVAGHQTRGLTHDQGLQKEFRAAAQAVEQSLAKANRDDLSVRLLQIRRAEKDYQLRQKTDGDKYRALTLENCTALENSLTAADAAFADPVRQALVIYRKAFTALAEQDSSIGDHEKNLSETTRALEPLLDVLHDNAERLATEGAIAMSTTAKKNHHRGHDRHRDHHHHRPLAGHDDGRRYRPSDPVGRPGAGSHCRQRLHRFHAKHPHR